MHWYSRNAACPLTVRSIRLIKPTQCARDPQTKNNSNETTIQSELAPELENSQIKVLTFEASLNIQN